VIEVNLSTPLPVALSGLLNAALVWTFSQRTLGADLKKALDGVHGTLLERDPADAQLLGGPGVVVAVDTGLRVAAALDVLGR
jgi:hypothetical protein